MAVSADAAGGSHRLPGMYRRSSENWRQILTGEVLRDEYKGYWLKQLKLSMKDELYHTLTVVDGKLYLINLLSDLDNPGTILELGSKASPLIEVITGQKRILPKITSVKDITFFAVESDLESLDYQLILISVRCDSCNGDGLTLAMGVKHMTGDRQTYKLVGQPWVIDYKFYAQNELAKLFVYDREQKTYNLRSGIASDFLNNSDLSVFKHHEAVVAAKVAEIMANGKDSFPPVTVTLNSGQMGETLTPTMSYKLKGGGQQPSLVFNPFVFTQTYSLRNLTVQMKIQNDSAELTRPLLLNFKSENQPAIFGGADPSFSIFVADDKLFLLQKTNGNLSLLELGDGPPADYHQYEIYESMMDYPGASNSAALSTAVQRKILILSTLSEGRGKVEAYKLAFHKTGAIIVEDRIQLLDHGLKDFELELRTRTVNGQLLFDSLTPPVQSKDEYAQTFSNNNPLINLSDSKNEKIAYAFAEPKYIVTPDASAFYRYQAYAPSPLLPNPTGLYSSSPNAASQKNSISLGELLSRDLKSENTEGEVERIPLLGEKPRTSIEGIGSVRLEFMAMDSTFKKGKNSFKLVVAITSNDNRFSAQFAEISLPFPFENLSAVRVFPGRKNHDHEIVFLYSYEKQTADSRIGLTNAVVLRATEGTQGAIDFKFEKESQVATDLLDHPQMRSRVVYDEDGGVNFLRDPRIARDDRRLEVYNFASKTVLRPNADRSAIKLIWDAKEDNDGESYEEQKISWLLPYRDLDKRFAFIPKRSRDAEATYMWGNIFSLLDNMAQQRAGDKIQVLLVPPDMKKYVNELVLARYGRRVKERDASPFHVSNRSLRVYQIDTEATSTQDDILDNLESIQKQNRETNLILGDMAQILRLDRPISKVTNFRLSTVSAQEATAPSFGEDTEVTQDETLPHMLYLLAAGSSLQPDELAAKPMRNYSTILISTPDEWNSAKKQAEMEMENGLADRFAVAQFPLPSAEDRAQLLSQLFQDRNILLMRFQFNATGISKPPPVSQDAHLAKLMEYAVMRVASEAENSGQDDLNSFVAFRNQFAQQLLRDRTIRQTKVIDKAFIERVLTSVFDIPVNLESLPPDDPIFILSRRDAIRMLQDRGVMGPFAIKARFIKTMLSVLKNDPTRNIPSSHIVIGESGSGKTRMVTGLLNLLFPIQYDFNNPMRNTEANSLRINVGKLVAGKEDASRDQMTFKEIKNHIDNFLVNGYRGAIFFDDFHAAPESVRTELLGLVRTLLETQGLYTARSYDGQEQMVPLRHLHLIIALNPTENQTLIDSFRKDKDKPATFEEVLLASLSTKDLKIERSFIKRVGVVHNMLKFPHGAKAPALSADVMKISRDIMLRKQKLVLNSAGAIRAVADAFPQMDARTFLSTASSSLVDQVDPQLYPNGTLFHVIPGRRRTALSSFLPPDLADNSEKGQIEDYVLRNTKVLPLTDSSPESQLHFIMTLTHNFRLPLLEQFLISLEDDERFAESIDNQRNFLLPSMMGLRNHLNQNPDIPLNELNLDPNGFGLRSSGDRELFREIMRDVSTPGLSYFPFPISRIEQAEGWNILLTGETTSVGKSRATLITRYYLRVLAAMQQYTKKYFYLDSLEAMPDSHQWLKTLPQQSSEQALRPSISELREIYWKFFSEINDPSLRNPGEPAEAHLTPYAISRVFFYLIDKAITEMPWIQVNKHLVRTLDQVVQDQVLGQSPAVKSYFFDYKYSPIRAANPELIQQMVDSSQLTAEYSLERQQSIHGNYISNCEKLLGGAP